MKFPSIAGPIRLLATRGKHDLSTQPVLARALELAAAHSNVVDGLSALVRTSIYASAAALGGVDFGPLRRETPVF